MARICKLTAYLVKLPIPLILTSATMRTAGSPHAVLPAASSCLFGGEGLEVIGDTQLSILNSLYYRNFALDRRLNSLKKFI